jgi:hypothetical protein
MAKPDGDTREEPAVEHVDPRVLLLEEMWGDEEQRPQLQAWIKKHHPKARIPELDARAAVKAEIDEWRKEREEDRKAREKERDAASLAKARASIVEEGLIEESDIPEVEKLMRDHLIGDHQTAARFFQMTQRTAAPRSTPVQMPVGEEFKGVYKDWQAWRKKRAYDVFNEIVEARGRRR